MPLSVVGEIVAGLVLELVGDLFTAGAVAGVDAARSSSGQKAARREERALASADIVVLAAWHDAKVTEAEREELARRLEPSFEKLGMKVTVPELVERWSGPRMALASDAAFSAAVRSLAEDLQPRERTQTFEAVASVLRADANRGDVAVSPFRERASADQTPAIRLFAAALGVSPDEIGD